MNVLKELDDRIKGQVTIFGEEVYDFYCNEPATLEEIELVTQEIRNEGYDISDSWYCFIQCLFCDDILLLDLNKEKNYIVDGDVGYPSSEWEYINSDINTFLARLCQCNGAVYWRW